MSKAVVLAPSIYDYLYSHYESLLKNHYIIDSHVVEGFKVSEDIPTSLIIKQNGLMIELKEHTSTFLNLIINVSSIITG